MSAQVLLEVAAERKRQDEKWGEQNHPNLSSERGGAVHVVMEDLGVLSAHIAQQVVDNLARRGSLGYAEIAIEEFAEALEEAARGDDVALRKELVQTAAVLVAWVECIDRRTAKIAQLHALADEGQS